MQTARHEQNGKRRNTLQRAATRLLHGVSSITLVIVILVALAIACGFAFFLAFSPWALIALFAAVWFPCAMLFFADDFPWERTRVAIALLTAWLADSILYVFAVGYLSRGFRHFVPSIIVVSLYIGYLAWRITAQYAKPDASKADNNNANPMGLFAALLLAIFVMFYVVDPLMNHFFPWYWHALTALLLHSDSGD